jgi:hypothetical protein
MRKTVGAQGFDRSAARAKDVRETAKSAVSNNCWVMVMENVW